MHEDESEGPVNVGVFRYDVYQSHTPFNDYRHPESFERKVDVSRPTIKINDISSVVSNIDATKNTVNNGRFNPYIQNNIDSPVEKNHIDLLMERNHHIDIKRDRQRHLDTKKEAIKKTYTKNT